MIIGTAGHIDHGKTSLIARLTGKNTDRLPEEKRRGISIELGYAYSAVPSSAQTLGFVDVPGHEKFVHAMVSGATGIDFALLVIAADDGPMPQTVEHLDILRLLGIREGAVVLTKTDLVDPAVGDQTVEAIAQSVAEQPAEHWPLFPVSSVTGEGIDALLGFLQEKSRQMEMRSTQGHFRLAVDRVFTLAGLGTIVTGTAHSGQVRVGDEVSILPRAITGRVRSLHAQDAPAEFGRAGQRLALNLAGVALDQVERGDWIAGRDLSNVVQRIDVSLQVSALHGRTITQGLEVHLHHGTRDGMARIYPLNTDRIPAGESGLAHLQSDQPLSVSRGDRFVIRDSQARATLGGGIVLDIYPPARKKRAPERLAVLSSLSGTDSEIAFKEFLQYMPCRLTALSNNWNLTAQEVETLIAQVRTPVAGGVAFHEDRWRDFRSRVVLATDEAHAREPEMPGIELNRLRRVATPQLEADVFSELIESLVLEGLVRRKGVFVARPDHKAELSAAESNLWQSISPLLDQTPYNPPRVRDIAKLVNIPEGEIRANLRKVSRMGEVTLVALDHFFLTHRVAEMAEIVGDLSEKNGKVRAADFRDRIGGGRKVAIQILEFFDRIGFTRRLRDDHIVRRSNPFAEMLV